MDREEVLSLLRQRTGRADLVDVVARRYPDVDPPEELVPLTLALMADPDITGRVAHRIPELSEECRDVLRLRLQGKSFDEIGEELDVKATEVYAQCRRRLFPSTKPIPEYGAGMLDDAARHDLFRRALRDRRSFDSLRDEHTLLELTADPVARAHLLAAAESVRFSVMGTVRNWLERPRSKVVLGLAVIAVLSIVVQQCAR